MKTFAPTQIKSHATVILRKSNQEVSLHWRPPNVLGMPQCVLFYFKADFDAFVCVCVKTLAAWKCCSYTDLKTNQAEGKKGEKRRK